ncbi:MAG: efflux RND transporter periplasmic adaptor subunit [Pseudomonadota bacterium]
MQNTKTQAAGTLLTGAALGALIAGGLWYGASRITPPNFIATAEASTAAAPAPTVDVVRAEARVVTEWDEFTGRFQAVDEVAIRARVSGYLDAVHFEAGQVVEKGDLLFTIDPRPFEAALAEAEARLAEAEAAAELADTELTRAERLRAGGHVAQSVLDTRAQEAASAAASIAAAEAAVERARLDLGFTEIHAPVTGRISDDAVSPGNLIAAGAGAEALTTVVSLDPIHFVFDATEGQYLEYLRATETEGLRSRAGETPVAVRLIDEVDFAHPGTIDFVDNRIDRATGTIRGRAVLQNDDGVLTPGMFGRLRLATAIDTTRVVIPETAIGSDQAARFVLVVDEAGTVHRRAVELGDRLTVPGAVTARVVTAGIAPGEQVITGGLHMARPGATVTARLDDAVDNGTEVAAR